MCPLVDVSVSLGFGGGATVVYTATAVVFTAVQLLSIVDALALVAKIAHVLAGVSHARWKPRFISLCRM